MGMQEVGTKDKWPSAEDLRTLKWRPLDVSMDGLLTEGKEG